MLAMDSDISRTFLGRLVDTSKIHKGATMVGAEQKMFSENEPSDALKMQFLALPALRFL